MFSSSSFSSVLVNVIFGPSPAAGTSPGPVTVAVSSDGGAGSVRSAAWVCCGADSSCLAALLRHVHALWATMASTINAILILAVVARRQPIYAPPMSDLAQQFADAQAKIKPVTGLSNDVMLDLYALYKQ